MAPRVGLGQYVATTSAVHALDPRVKVGIALAVMVSVFFVRTPPQLAYAWALTLAAVGVSGVPATRILESVMPIAAVVVVLGVFNLLLVRSGEVLLAAGPLVVTSEGAWAAVLYPLRLVVGVVTAALLLATTTPAQLTDAFDATLSPLARIGLPGHELAMVFSLMLRFIPTLADDAVAIADAQATRGGGLGEGGPVRRMRAVVAIVVALLASAVRHANNLSRALDARCYVGGAQRTHWHRLRLHRRDGMALALACAYLVGLWAVGRLF